MDLQRIVCIPDLLQPSRSSYEGLLDLVREPLRQGCGIDFDYLPVRGRRKPPLDTFEPERFRTLAAAGAAVGPDALWAGTYHAMPADAEAYLFERLPGASLVLACNVPPWLRRACIARAIPFLDLRLSPLGFGRDLYLALDAPAPPLRQRIAARAVGAEELRLEAALLGANLRAHRRRLEEAKRHAYDLDNSLVCVVQPAWDSALLAADGSFGSLDGFAARIGALAGARRILCLVDYSDPATAAHGELQCRRLSERLGVAVTPCPQSGYQVLAAEEDVALAGISAPLLQEAPWFGRSAHWLGEPATPLADADASGGEGYLQVRFQDALAPEFWHQLLSPHAPPPVLARLPALDRHHGREALDAWGEYEKVLNWERLLPWRAFERSGGIVQRRRINALEQVLVAAPATAASDAATEDPQAGSMRQRIRRLRDTRTGRTAYVLGNGPSLRQLDIDALMQRESFWCNRAFELENEGYAFRPPYYLMGDAVNFQRWAPQVMAIRAGTKFFGREAYAMIEKGWPQELERQSILALEVSQTPGACMFDAPGNFSHDPSIMIYSGYTVVLAAVQLAFYMGFSRVLVGGVDLDYTQPYFHGGMHTRRQEDMDILTDYMRRSFVVARRHFEDAGRLLATITDSPHLPLARVEDPDTRGASA